MEPDSFVQLMLSSLLDFQQRGVLCDTILRTEDGEVPAHSIVLAATSAKLKRELIRVDSEPGMQHIIELPDFAVTDVKCVLEYVYTGLPPVSMIGSRDIGGIVTLCETLEIPQPLSWINSIADNRMIGKIEAGIVGIEYLNNSIFNESAKDAFETPADQQNGDVDVQKPGKVDEYPYKCDTCKREFKRLAALRLHEKVHWATSADAIRKKKVPKSEKSTPLKTPSGKTKPTADKVSFNSPVIEHSNGSLVDMEMEDSLLMSDVIQKLELIEVKKEIFEQELSPNALKRRSCSKCDEVFNSSADLLVHRRTAHINTEELVYVCDCCDRRFKFASNLIDHHRTHDDTACNICGLFFATYKELYRHRFVHCKTKNEWGEWIFSCRVCAQQFPSKAAVREHRIQEHMQCAICSRFFLKPSKLRRHEFSCRRRHEGLSVAATIAVALEPGEEDESGDGFLCGECGKVFARQASLVSHKKVHVSREYYKKIYESSHHTCQVCSRAFAKLSRLKRHEEGCRVRVAKALARETMKNIKKANTIDSAGEGSFPCQECGKVFDKPSSLSSHKKIHAPDEFRCETCGKVFTKRYYLTNHELSHSDVRPHKCAHCEKAFKQFSQMLRHVQRRHVGGPRPHMCSECGRTFAVKSDLKDHEGIHTGEKAHMCDQCGMQFRTRGILRVHLRQHTGVRPFECRFCGRRFAQLSNRLKHETIHTGICPVKCDQCGRGFADTSALKRHELFHSGLRPHVCPVCSRTFALKSTLNAHLQIHESVRQHSCPICNKAFVLRSGLMRHLKIHARRAAQGALTTGSKIVSTSSSFKRNTIKNEESEEDEEVAYEPDVLHAMYIAENVVELSAVE